MTRSKAPAMRESIKNFLIISRANIQIASLPTAAVGIILAARNLSELWDVGVFLYILLFFLVLTFACNLNCMADVEVDAKFKKRLSEAVRSLGGGRMRSMLSGEALIAAGLVVGLAVLEKNIVFLLGIGGLGIAYIYSAPPLRIKKRGWLSPLPVMFGLYALPPLGGWYLVRGHLSGFIWAFSLGYAMLMEGITIINTCEDYPEDESSGIRTLAHVLGIRRTLVLGAWLAGIGGIMDLAMLLGTKVAGTPLGPMTVAGIGVLGSLYTWTVASIVRVLRRVAHAEDPIGQSKSCAELMPLWFIKTRYALFFMALLLI
jgi:4-hydroxybenzoate polyprenyltransferase